ncbi:Calcium-transporting ATPase 2 [Nakaseomyces bracarensis]|uniref:Calcium-transporting ATPase n=1 Tax=Nakaseomyces bracarensis TaxID=273131 RepID=A0ABR4NPG9_9SACH
MTPDDLGGLHNPKSVKAYKQYFGDEKGLYTKLETDAVKGISESSAEKRTKQYGSNKLPERKPKSFLTLVWEAFNDKTMLLLTTAAIVSFTLGIYEVMTQPPEYDPEGNKITKVDWIEGLAIMMAVVVVVVVSAANDYQKEMQFHRLNQKREDREIIVIRDDKETLISIHDLLVGDLVSLQTGDVIPADCILVKGECESDESSITGESETIKKVTLREALSYAQDHAEQDIGEGKFPDCMLISGSRLLSGLGKAVVTAVGVHSMHGKTMASLKEETESTPLQQRLSQLTDNISVYGCVSAITLFVVLFVRFLFYIIPSNGRFHDLPAAEKGSKFMDIFITSITVIVVAVPEGLPLAVTLALAFATTRMTKDGNLVRVLRSCETMGSATAVCSDKTGTLTENIMTVVRGNLGGTHFDDIGSNPSKSDIVYKKQCSKELRTQIFTNIVLNSTAFENKDYKEPNQYNSIDRDSPKPLIKRITKSFQRKKTQKADDEESLISNAAQGRQEPYIGSKTETALLSLAKKSFGLIFGSLQSYRNDPEQVANITIEQIIPFESSRKWSGLVVKYKPDGAESSFKYRLYVKGAAEIVSRACTNQHSEEGEIVEIDKEKRAMIEKEIVDLADHALRAISLSHKDFDVDNWPPKEFIDPENEHEALATKLIDPKNPVLDGMVLDAIVGIQDPLRESVKDAVAQCQKAGVTVRMVTGDNLLTAKAIARNCGILSTKNLNDSQCAMEGPKFRQLGDEERKRILPKLRVLARSSPEDKKILVGTLKEMGDVVAVTGDGTNDAPALKLADVGFSMGITGTEVAREASDIILMTDDFSAIVNAIKWGRCVAISIKKFIQFQLIVNVTAVLLTFVTSVISEEVKSVLTAVQLLWVNLIMDTLAALALATDKPDPNIMDRKPKGRSTPLITPSTWKMIIGQATLQLVVTFTLYFHGAQYFFGVPKEELPGHKHQQINAMIFNTFVWLQWFTLLVSRKLGEADGIKDWRKRITATNLNFFQDLFRNFYFIFIMLLIAILQVLIMFFGGAPFSIARQTKEMWLVAIFCGTLSLPVGALIRICPDEWAEKVFPRRLARIIQYIGGLEFLRTVISDTDTESEEEEEADDRATPGSSTAYF